MAVPMAATAEMDNNLSTKVELYMCCRNLKNMDLLSKSDPFIVVYSREKRTYDWKEIMRTKTIMDNLNPDFTEQLVMDYHFELVQSLRFDVYDRDCDSNDLKKHDFIGSVETTLSKIMGARGSTFSAELIKTGSTSKSSRGRIIIRGEEVNSCKDVAHLQFSALKLDRKDWFGLGKSDPFVTISRLREDSSFVKVWESETIMKELNPNFESFKLPVQVLCNGDLDRPIKISVYDWNSNGSHDLIGSFTSSLRALQPDKTFTLVHEDIKKKKGSRYKGSGTFIVKQSRIEKRHSFLDYIRGGCELNMIVAIDFTASNGAYSTPQSLHYQAPNAGTVSFRGDANNNNTQLNEYQRAILACGEVLQDYDSDNLYPVYGFGGQVNGQVNHCFPLNFDNDHPEVQGVDGILDVYKNAFNFVSLSGPTLFSRILAMANSYAQRHCTQDNQAYTVLLILTDGVINDMDQSIEQIVEGSELPLSIIIIGVGNADFSNMEILDADDTPLSYRGRKMKRDIVQFVPFRKFINQHYSALAAETLAEIPEQVVSYMTSQNIVPNAPSLASSRHFANQQSTMSMRTATSTHPSSRNFFDANGPPPDAVPFAVPIGTVPTAPPPAPSQQRSSYNL